MIYSNTVIFFAMIHCDNKFQYRPALPSRFYELTNLKIWMCELCTFSQIRSHLVMKRLKKADLKLQPAKCQFILTEVEYLSHVISPDGLKTNARFVAAVKEFPKPKDIRELRRFLGLSSYYRRFIPQFAKLAGPLHDLT